MPGERGSARSVDRDPSTAPQAPDDPVASTRIVTVPNILSFVRLATVPLFVWLFVSGRENAAVILYMVGAWSDFFDGYIARKTDSVSELGKLLDPLADRVFIAALVVALVMREVLPLWLALAIVGRDLILLSLFPLLERWKIERIAVNRMGKTATAALLLGLTLLAVSQTTFPAAGSMHLPGLISTSLGAVLYWGATYLYGREAARRLRALRDSAR